MVTALLQQNALCVKQGQAFRVQRQARSARMATRQVTKAIGEVRHHRVARGLQIDRATAGNNPFTQVNVIVGGSTIAALALGRFVFLPFQRRTNTNAGLPVQNGTTHFEAGDKFAQEAR